MCQVFRNGNYGRRILCSTMCSEGDDTVLSRLRRPFNKALKFGLWEERTYSLWMDLLALMWLSDWLAYCSSLVFSFQIYWNHWEQQHLHTYEMDILTVFLACTSWKSIHAWAISSQCWQIRTWASDSSFVIYWALFPLYQQETTWECFSVTWLYNHSSSLFSLQML